MRMKACLCVIMIIMLLLCWLTCATADECAHPDTACVYVQIGYQHQKQCDSCGYIWEAEDHQGVLVSISATEHQEKCEYCDATLDDALEHYAFCNAPDYCSDCGAEDIVAGIVNHAPCYPRYPLTKYDNEQHQYHCGALEAHKVSCKNPTVCNDCGAEDLVLESKNMSHPFSAVDMGDQHELWCENCWYSSGPEDHDYAGGSDQCWICGRLAIADTCVHPEESVEITFDGYDSHVMTCTICGIFVDQESCDFVRKSISNTLCADVCEVCGGYDKYMTSAHVGYCSSQNKCVWCGEEGVTLYQITHEEDAALDYFSNEKHQYSCCGELEDHYIECDAPSTCLICGTTDLKWEMGDIEHDYEVMDLGSQHQAKCYICGYTLEPEDHPFDCYSRECWRCGHIATDEEYEVVEHGFQIYWNVYSHLLDCMDCTVIIEEPHTFYCDDLNHCTVCNIGKAADDEDSTIIHRRGTYSAVNEEMHKWSCSGCGEEELSGHEFGNDKTCDVCAYTQQPEVIRLPGDASDDKQVSLVDAIDILLGDVVNALNADVNADGDVDAYDALLILQYIAGWNVTLK